MRYKKVLGITAIILFVIGSTSVNAQKIDHYLYAEYISKDRILTWNVATMEGFDNKTFFTKYELHENDVVKIKILKTIVNLHLREGIWNYTANKWAEL
ncbi:MAG: hypothetical protein ACTSYD_12080 [Candidatus Heimdallarchaeaceae archaeon]